MSEDIPNNTQKKRVIFCTYSSIYSSLVLKKLLIARDIDVVGVINSTRVLNSEYGAIQASLKQIKLSGWRYSTYLFLITDLFSLLSSFVSLVRRKKAGYQQLKTVTSYAKDNNIPIVETSDINDPFVISFIESQTPDYLLAAHFNQLIKPSILDSANFSCINIHPSLLPGYKGVDPVFYALLNKEKNVGVSLHEMLEVFDTGKIFSQEAYPSNLFNNVYSHNCKLFETGARMAIEYMENKNKAEGKNQGEGGYDSWPSATLVAKFRKDGYKLISIKELLFKI